MHSACNASITPNSGCYLSLEFLIIRYFFRRLLLGSWCCGRRPGLLESSRRGRRFRWRLRSFGDLVDAEGVFFVDGLHHVLEHRVVTSLDMMPACPCQ